MIELSADEKQTQETYEHIAEERFKRIKNIDFWRDEFVRFQQWCPKGKILDVGCGTGRDAHFFDPKTYEYLGIDFSEASLAIARKHNSGYRFALMNMYELSFPNHTFDGVWSLATYIHTPHQKMHAALNELHRVLKPGGTLLIGIKEGHGEGMEQGPLLVDKRFVSYYGRDEFEKILQHNKFRILDTAHKKEDGLFKKDVTWLNYFAEALP